MEKITKDAFLDFTFLGALKASPEESRYALLASEAKEEANTYHHTLHIGDGERIERRLNLKKNQNFCFLDETTLLINYQKNKSEKKALEEDFRQRFYTYDIGERNLKPAFYLPFPAKIEARIDEERVLLSAQMDKKDHVLYEGTEEERKAYLKEKKREKAFEDIEEIPYYFDGQNFVANKHRQFFIYDIRREETTRLFKKSFAVENHAFSKDQRILYYTGKEKEGVMTMTTNIYAYDIAEGTHEALYEEKDYAVSLLAELGGTLVVAAKDMKSYGVNENPDFFTVEDGALKPLQEFGQSIGNTVGSDARLLGSEQSFVRRDRLYFVSTIDDHCELFALGLDGSLETVVTVPGSIDGVMPFQDGIRLIAMQNQRLQELYRITDGSLKRLSNFNRKALANRYVATPQPLEIERGEHTVKGFVLLPKNYTHDKAFPAVLDIHGGPKTVYGEVFYHEMQYWVNLGYVVFYANPRGSDGKGDAFADIRGRYGTVDYEDLMAFTDAVLEAYPGIDAENLFVTGGSYGGFMTNWIVSHTDRFKAAVTQRSIANWYSFYGTSDIGFFFASDQAAGDPVSTPEALKKQSPITYADRIKTPLLFIHADQDHRCPIEQAQQLFAILKYRGVETKLVWIKGESHGLSRAGSPQARLKRLGEITGWFEHYRYTG